MKKNIVQDVVFPKRSIREVELPSRKKESSFTAPVQKTISKPEPVAVSKAPVIPDPFVEDGEDTVLHRRIPTQSRSPYTFDYNNDIPAPKESKIGLWVSIALFIVALGFGVSALFVSAEVSIQPKTQSVPINTALTALKDRPAGEFGYQVVSVSSSVERAVSAGSAQKVDKKATGTIIVYNNATEAPQKLIANTRFESSDGKVFRIANAISIPGRKTENGKAVPGSVEAVVTADQPGDAYNLGLVDFTVPGLKGDPRYTTIYARSKAPMTGGFSGEMKVIDPNLEKVTQKELEIELKDALKKDIASQIPLNFILFPDALSYEIEAVSQKNTTEGDSAVLTVKGTAHALIFDRDLLSKSIMDNLKDSVATDGQLVSVTNLEKLTFVLTGNSVIGQNTTTSVTFTVSGDAQIEWLYDESILKNDLLGIKKSDLASLLQAKYPSIESARVKIRPVWKRSFPIDPSKVTLIKLTPTEK